MNTLLIILSFIGLLKLVSLIVLCYITIVMKQKNKEINDIIKYYGIYKDDSWYIIPTIRFSKGNNYFELMFEWLCIQYYSCYKIRFENESSSV